MDGLFTEVLWLNMGHIHVLIIMVKLISDAALDTHNRRRTKTVLIYIFI